MVYIVTVLGTGCLKSLWLVEYSLYQEHWEECDCSIAECKNVCHFEDFS